VPLIYLLWHGASVFLVSLEGPSHSIAHCYTQRDTEELFNPDPHRSVILHSDLHNDVIINCDTIMHLNCIDVYLPNMLDVGVKTIILYFWGP
jgi:hypothetical protein